MVVDFEEPDDPVPGLFHRLIIGVVIVGVLFALYIIFCIVGKRKGWFERPSKDLNPKSTAAEGRGYVYRERDSEVVRESRPVNANEANVYQNEQQEHQRPSAVDNSQQAMDSN